MINIFFLINRQGKIRLTKFFDSFNLSERNKLLREIAVAVISRSSRLSNFYDYQNYKVIYKRYASLYFICLCDLNDNELTVLEFIHHYVECLDKYFGNVCELDIIFNFNKAYYILEEILQSGHVQESNKKEIRKVMEALDSRLTEEKEDEYTINSTITTTTPSKKK